MIAISAEQPPANVDPAVAEYITRMFIQIAGALQEIEYRIIQIENRITTLESKVP